MTNNSSTGTHDYELEDVVFYQRWIQCQVVGIGLKGMLTLQAYNPKCKTYSGKPFLGSRFDCERKIIHDRSLLNTDGIELITGPIDPAARDMIDRIKNMAD